MTATETEDDPGGRAHRWLAEVGAPDWIKAEMSGLRRETAGHRQRRKAAEAESERLAGELATATRQGEELRTALRGAEGRAVGLSAELSARIEGTTAAEIRADAQAWAEALRGAR